MGPPEPLTGFPLLSSCGSEQGPVWDILKNAMHLRVRQNKRDGGLTEGVHRACISIFDQTRSGSSFQGITKIRYLYPYLADIKFTSLAY
jgi:hypothetical protein